MPWTEMSQAEFLQYVVSFPIQHPKLVTDDVLLQASTALMEQVVRDPERLFRSAYKVLHNKGYRNTNNNEEVKSTPYQSSDKSSHSNAGLSATEKLSTIFARKNCGSKSNNETPPSPKLLSRNSRLGSMKTKTTPVLQRKCKDKDEKIDSFAENDISLCHSSDQNSRPNSMIIQVPVS